MLHKIDLLEKPGMRSIAIRCFTTTHMPLPVLSNSSVCSEKNSNSRSLAKHLIASNSKRSCMYLYCSVVIKTIGIGLGLLRNQTASYQNQMTKFEKLLDLKHKLGRSNANQKKSNII